MGYGESALVGSLTSCLGSGHDGSVKRDESSCPSSGHGSKPGAFVGCREEALLVLGAVSTSVSESERWWTEPLVLNDKHC